jgi:hypothetical protein
MQVQLHAVGERYADIREVRSGAPPPRALIERGTRSVGECGGGVLVGVPDVTGTVTVSAAASER